MHVSLEKFMHSDSWPSDGGDCCMCGTLVNEGEGIFVAAPTEHHGLYCVKCYLTPIGDGSGITRCG